MYDKYYKDGDVNDIGYIQDHIDSAPAIPGGRHEDMLKLSYKMVGEGYPYDEIFRTLRERYPDSDKSDKEIRDLICGAHKRNPQPATTSRRQAIKPQPEQPKIKAFVLGETSQAPEIPTSNATLSDFLHTAFNPDEVISWTKSATKRGDKWLPNNSGSFYTVQEFLTFIEQEGIEKLDGMAGAWIRVNPIKQNDEGVTDESGTDASIAELRHVLVEFDNIPKEQQYQIFKQSRLPITAIINSGGKSLHAWVRVDAQSKEEYKEKAGLIYDYFAAYSPDQSNKNPSRYSRLPGVKRDGKMQQLVELNVGAESWDDWYEEKTNREMVGGSVLDYAHASIDEGATLLGNRYLCRGGGMFIVAPSGQGKSTLAVQLMTEWAIGGNPLGIASNSDLRVMLIQAEDDQGDLTEMSRWILEAGFSDEKLSKMARNTHVEPVNDVVGDNFIATLDNLCKQWKPDIVIINPYTSYLGDDAKDEKAANKFLREGLTPVLVRHNCAAIIMHHTPKTPFNRSTDYTTSEFMYRGSGCATMTNWARAYLVFEPLPEDEKIFRFVAAKRGQRIGWDSQTRFFRHSRTPGVIKWEPANKEELDAALAKQDKKPVFEESVYLSKIGPEPTLKSTVENRIKEVTNHGARFIKDHLQEMALAGKIHSWKLPRTSKRGAPPEGWSTKVQPEPELPISDGASDDQKS